ncbi:hypothetical protein ACIRU3_43050 [Streptomyces sp. NPDC101151]|uniref:hypothetical protein n=1 Tax=Streptomyces sp. NPDC101151 TaxID=3366115 RepID=UPI00380BC9DF
MTQAQQGTKSAREALYEAMWGSPIAFAVLSVLACIKSDNDDWAFGKTLAWWMYLGGWVPLVLMCSWALARQKKPKWSTGVAGVALLVAAGTFQLALNRPAAPWH